MEAGFALSCTNPAGALRNPSAGHRAHSTPVQPHPSCRHEARRTLLQCRSPTRSPGVRLQPALTKGCLMLSIYDDPAVWTRSRDPDLGFPRRMP